MNGIVWIASYPKSGNTWLRIFLKSLLAGADAPESLDELGTTIASSRLQFDELSGLASSDLTPDDIDLLRPRVYEQMVEEAERLPLFLKCHDAFSCLPNGEPLLSRRATAGAIYIVRNPLDVAVSYAHHLGHGNYQLSIAHLAQRRHALGAATASLSRQFRQSLLRWSDHVRSWISANIPCHVMRYEDMQASPQETFSAAVRFAGLQHTEQEIEAALEKSRFERLQQLEKEKGFRERPATSKTFFRQGQAGAWRKALRPEQVQAVVEEHGEVMRQFGYLGPDGEP